MKVQNSPNSAFVKKRTLCFKLHSIFFLLHAQQLQAKNIKKNYRVQAKSFDIEDLTFVLEFKSRRAPKTPRSDDE